LEIQNGCCVCKKSGSCDLVASSGGKWENLEFFFFFFSSFSVAKTDVWIPKEWSDDLLLLQKFVTVGGVEIIGREIKEVEIDFSTVKGLNLFEFIIVFSIVIVIV
jgi:hypothetical protein